MREVERMDLSQIKQETLVVASTYKPEPRFLLAVLQDIQRKYKYLPKQSLEVVSEYLDVPLTKVYGVVTFYKAFSLTPKGENIIKVCDGTACHIKGSMNLITEIKAVLGIDPGQTTADGKFSLEIVNCIGSCALAPVMMINESYYGKLTPAKLRAVLESYREGGMVDAK